DGPVVEDDVQDRRLVQAEDSLLLIGRTSGSANRARAHDRAPPDRALNAGVVCEEGESREFQAGAWLHDDGGAPGCGAVEVGRRLALAVDRLATGRHGDGSGAGEEDRR